MILYKFFPSFNHICSMNFFSYNSEEPREILKKWHRYTNGSHRVPNCYLLYLTWVFFFLIHLLLIIEIGLYNFYLNKLFKFFFILKEIIMIIKTHIKLTLNMYNLFSKFYWKERERERDYLWWGTKKYNTKTYESKIVLQITMIH